MLHLLFLSYQYIHRHNKWMVLLLRILWNLYFNFVLFSVIVIEHDKTSWIIRTRIIGHGSVKIKGRYDNLFTSCDLLILILVLMLFLQDIVDWGSLWSFHNLSCRVLKHVVGKLLKGIKVSSAIFLDSLEMYSLLWLTVILLIFTSKKVCHI